MQLACLHCASITPRPVCRHFLPLADRNELSICLKSYLRFHPGAYYMREGLRRRMVALQAQVRVPCT